MVNPKLDRKLSILSYHVEPQDLLQSLPLKRSIILPLSSVLYALKHYVLGVTSSIHLGSLDTKILYFKLFQKFFSHPSVSLSSFINLVAKVNIFIKLIMYVCFNSYCLQMSLRSLCLLFMRSIMLRILLCIPQCFHLLHDGTTNFPSCIDIAS